MCGRNNSADRVESAALAVEEEKTAALQGLAARAEIPAVEAPAEVVGEYEDVGYSCVNPFNDEEENRPGADW